MEEQCTDKKNQGLLRNTFGQLKFRIHDVHFQKEKDKQSKPKLINFASAQNENDLLRDKLLGD